MKEFLTAIHIFAGLSDAALDFLTDLAQPLDLKNGEFVFLEGAPSNAFYVIDSGSVEIIKGVETNHPVHMATLQSGDFFGEMSMLECQKRNASVRCLQDTRLHSLKSSDLHLLYQKWPGQYAIVILNIARDLSRRLHALDESFAARAH